MGMGMGSVYGPGPVAAAASVLIPPSPGGQAGMSLKTVYDRVPKADGQDHIMQSPHFPMLDIQPLVFELLHSAWSWASPLQDPSILVKVPMRTEHSGLNTHMML
jgi:hypothetical protein